MGAKKPNDARVEVAVKGRAIEAWRIGAQARQVCCELRRTGCQEGKVTGRADVNVRLARQAAGEARSPRRPHAAASQLGSPELQRDLDRRQVLLREDLARRIDNHRGPDLWRTAQC